MIEAIVDPTGAVITELRSYGDLVDMLGDQKRVIGQEGRIEPPIVIVQRVTTGLYPYGPGSGRIGLISVPYTIRCGWLGKNADGTPMRDADIRASALASLVVGCLRRVRPHTGSGGVRIHRIDAATIGQVLLDPATGEPYVVVTATVIAGAQAAT